VGKLYHIKHKSVFNIEQKSLFSRLKTWQDVGMKKHRRLQDEYQFPGFRPKAAIKGIFGDSHSVIVQLTRSQKKQHADAAERRSNRSTTGKYAGYEIYRAETNGCIWKSRLDEFSARSAGW